MKLIEPINDTTLFGIGILTIETPFAAPSIRTQKNIRKFAAMWAAGDMVACKESYTAARRYLDTFGNWLFKNMEPQHDLLVGVIEYTNFHDRADTSVKNWKP